MDIHHEIANLILVITFSKLVSAGDFSGIKLLALVQLFRPAPSTRSAREGKFLYTAMSKAQSIADSMLGLAFYSAA